MAFASTVPRRASTRGRGNRIQIERQRDYTGGLQLKENPYNLAQNESFELLNVDLGRRGGFSLRRGSQRFVSGKFNIGTIHSGYTYVDPSNVHHIIIATDGNTARRTGSGWTPFGGGGGVFTDFAEMRGDLYIIRGDHSLFVTTQKWSGSGSATALTDTAGAFNNDLTNPVNGKFPVCRTAAVHHDVMWAGYIREASSTWHPSRVRWSHPLKPEDWRTDDFIDVDPDDEHGSITAVIPFNDRLLVFKERAIYAIHGFPPEGFSLTNLTKELGAPTKAAIAATEDAVYFWDTHKGAWRYDGKQFTWIFQPLSPMIDEGKIDQSQSVTITAAYHNERLWLSVPYARPPYEGQRIALVFAPFVGSGAWTLHDQASENFWWAHRESNGSTHLLGAKPSPDVPDNFVYEFDRQNFHLDEVIDSTDPSTETHFEGIHAHYTTRWFDRGNPVEKKRWKRPVVVMHAGGEQHTQVDVFTDYDLGRVTKSFTLSTPAIGDGTAEWDVSEWDVDKWAEEIGLGDSAVVLNGSPLGGGISKALRFHNHTQGQDWRVHGISMKMIPKTIR